MNTEDLERYYYTPSRPGSYAGSENFLRALKLQKIDHDPKAVKEWLKKEETYTLIKIHLSMKQRIQLSQKFRGLKIH